MEVIDDGAGIDEDGGPRRGRPGRGERRRRTADRERAAVGPVYAGAVHPRGGHRDLRPWRRHGRRAQRDRGGRRQPRGVAPRPARAPLSASPCRSPSGCCTACSCGWARSGTRCRCTRWSRRSACAASSSTRSPGRPPSCVMAVPLPLLDLAAALGTAADHAGPPRRGRGPPRGPPARLDGRRARRRGRARREGSRQLPQWPAADR